MKRCTRCILPEDYPNISFNSEGVCNVCESWDKKWKEFDYQKSELELISVLENAKSKKRKYDCLIPFSGGRDSSYVLYLCKEKYGMSPLAVTFNNTFMSDSAMKNITNAVNFLGVDHVMLSYKPNVLREFYKYMIVDGGEFCSICTAGINYVKTIYQRLYNIPLVIMGTSTRVDEQSPFEITSTHPSYIRKVLIKNGVSEILVDDFLIKRQYELPAGEKIKLKLFDSDYVSINLPDYIDWNNDKIQKDLDENLGWTTPDPKADHIDCKFADVKYYLKNKQIPNFIFKQQKYSQLIRDNQITREEAITILEELINTEDSEPKVLDEFLDFFSLDIEEIKNTEKKSHLNYIGKDDLLIKEGVIFKALSTPWKALKISKKIFNKAFHRTR